MFPVLGVTELGSSREPHGAAATEDAHPSSGPFSHLRRVALSRGRREPRPARGQPPLPPAGRGPRRQGGRQGGSEEGSDFVVVVVYRFAARGASLSTRRRTPCPSRRSGGGAGSLARRRPLDPPEPGRAGRGGEGGGRGQGPDPYARRRREGHFQSGPGSTS